jgi:dihydroorotase
VITEADVTQEKLAAFLSRFGRQFYKLPEVSGKKIVLEKKGEKIPTSVLSEDGSFEVGISRVGAEVYSLRWEKA